MQAQQQSYPQPQTAPSQFSDAVPGMLRNLLARYGTELLGDAPRLRGLLTDEAPLARKEVSVLMLALEERVPHDLTRANSGEPLASLVPRLVRRLTEEKGVSPDAAHWAVNTWALGLGVQSVLNSQPVMQGYPQPDAVSGLSGYAAAPHSAANQGYPGSQPHPLSSTYPQAPAYPQASAYPAVQPHPLSQPLPPGQQPFPPQGQPYPQPQAVSQAHAYPQSATYPTGPAPVSMPASVSTYPQAAGYSMTGAPAGVPAQAAAGGAADKRKLAMGGAAAAVALAAAGWWFGVAKLDIARVETQGPFVGNGRPVPVFVEFDARNTQVRSAEVRLVKGDGNWGQTSWKFDVTSDGPNASRVAAGNLQVLTAKPISATFEYTLVAADGKRSAPFQRSFDVVPPLVITKVDVPRGLVPGREFTVGLNFQKSTSNVVKVERKVISSDTPFAEAEHSMPLSLGADASTLEYRFDPMSKPTKATVEFTLVDASGLRSDPMRVALNVGTVAVAGTGPGVVVAMNRLSFGLQAPGVGTVVGAIVGGIVGSQFGKGGGKAAMTGVGAATGAVIGSQVAGEGGGGGGSGPTWETTIRFDDGLTRAVRTVGSPNWNVGSRVNWSGSRLTLIR